MASPVLLLATCAVVTAGGVAAGVKHAKIYGGEAASFEDYPFMVALENRKEDQFCGGVAIAHYWVLTAGICVEDRDWEQMSVRAGSPERMLGGSMHRVEDVIVHPRFHQGDESSLDNDIALVQVCPPFSRKSVPKYAVLPGSGDVLKPGTKLTVIGWGQPLQLHEPSPLLLETQLNVISQALCSRTVKVTHRQLCATAPGRDATNGDNGGPLLARRGSGWVVQGVLASFFGEGDVNYPAVFTNVSSYLGWIHQHISLDEDYVRPRSCMHAGN